MSANDGGPAFPAIKGLSAADTGMTLRDYFATHATDEDVRLQAEQIRNEASAKTGLAILPDNWRATARYMHADAMLAAREEGGPQ